MVAYLMGLLRVAAQPQADDAPDCGEYINP